MKILKFLVILACLFAVACLQSCSERSAIDDVSTAKYSADVMENCSNCTSYIICAVVNAGDKNINTNGNQTNCASVLKACERCGVIRDCCIRDKDNKCLPITADGKEGFYKYTNEKCVEITLDKGL